MSKTDIEMSMGTAPATMAQPPEHAVAGDVHVLATSQTPSIEGGLYHTLRKSSGAWLLFRDVKAVAGDPGFVSGVASAKVKGELHVLVARDGGGLFHAVRRADGSWAAFKSVTAQAGDPGQFEKIAAANVGGVLHVAGVAGAGSPSKLVHTVLAPNGNFVPFGDVEAQTGDVGKPSSVAMVGSPGTSGELHLVAVASAQPGKERVLYTIRKADGSWLPFEDVEAQAGTLPTFKSHVAMAITFSGGPGFPGGLHLAVAAGHKLFHTMRQGNAWLPFGDVEGQTGNVGAVEQVELAQVGTNLHTFVLATAAGQGETFAHTIRRTDGSWLPFGNIEAQAGELGMIRWMNASGA